jgi:Putative beta-barrel porin 2
MLLFPLVLSAGLAKPPRATANQQTETEAFDRSAAADDLSQQVAEIAHSSAISRAKKEKRISTAVRVAVVAATAYKRDSDEIMGIALELAEAAARAAPSFAEVIANAVSFAPSLARIDAAAGRLRAATYAAAKAPGGGHRSTVAARKSRRPAPVAATEEEPEAPPVRHVARRAPREETETDTQGESTAMESPASDSPSMTPASSLSANSKFSVTADLSVRHDDNVYLTSNDKVGDTIIAVTPGVEFHFGQNSLTHGSLNYKTAFTRYADKTAPNVSLGSGSGDFGYDNGALAVAAAASFQQINQNNADVAALGQKAIYRRDLSAASGSVESHLTAKTSLKTGVNYSKSEYKTAGLTGSQETEVPLKFYYETTPKVSLSTGVAYRWVNPQNGGEKGKDLDYNVGARGNFTAKLNGEFSLDYRTRQVGDTDRENLWGLNGALNYELTPKTTSSLVFSRDFNTGALGESLKNSSYALKLSTDLSPQWLLGGGVTFRQIEYGPSVFRVNSTPTVVDRNDQYWEGNLQASYLYRSWLSATADFTLRRNHSSLSGAEFSNAILSFMLGWRY